MRVLEVGSSVAGAYCGRLFATQGSDVVLLESPGSGSLRDVGPFVLADGGTRVSALHEYLNASKRSVAVDADDPAVDQLLAWADIVVTSVDGDPDAAAQFDRRVKAANMAAVHVVTSGFGLTGPCSRWRHSGLTDWAAGGYLYLNGDPDREPLQGGGPWASYVAGATAAIAAQAALFKRTCTGRGQLVDVGAMEAVAAAHQWSLTMYTHTGVIKRRWGGRLGESYHPMSLYECRDGWVCVCAPLPDQWERLCIAVDQVELLLDERLMAPAERFDRAEEVDAALQPWFSARSAAEAVDALQAARVPAGRANTFVEVLAAEQLTARQYWARAPWISAGAMMPAAPFRVADRDVPARRAPALGCDTAAVLAEASTMAERRPFPRVDLRQLRAIETTVGWAGPLTARFLADLGIDVIKVEHPAGRGVSPAPPADPAWEWGTLPDPQLRAPVFPNADPGERWWNRMGVWNKINRNKRDVALDLKTAEGRDVLARLVERADIVIHNYTPRAAASMGLDAGGVARHNERAVTVLMSGYGETGPLASHASWGPILEAYAGFDEATGYPDGGPMRLGIAFPDAGGGLHGAFAALAGVWERERTNRSVHVDLSQLETLVSIAGESLLVSSVTRVAPVRTGNRSVQYAPQGCYRCAGHDAWVAITIRSDREWAALIGLVAVAALTELRDLDASARATRHDDIDAALSGWTSARSPDAVAVALQAVGIPACPVFTNGDLVDNDHLAARGFMVTWDQPDAGRQTFPGFPIHFERTRIPIRPAPALGADNDDVLTWLGYDAATIARLRERHVIADEPPTAG